MGMLGIGGMGSILNIGLVNGFQWEYWAGGVSSNGSLEGWVSVRLEGEKVPWESWALPRLYC